MPHQVFLTRDAIADLDALYAYIADKDGSDRADHVAGSIKAAFEGLSESPHRGTWPKELLELGIREYREVFFRAYRIIYRVIDETVYVMLIVDGRRDMQTLLQRRLVQG
ncbi:MAG: type II toxin-antitoxin system RelE/ParE family toxin [Xanthomonadales bacterium]|nr:type II toxin-antitoxin system RelE/ParE family toxin [Xanthomonadales bacterium]